MTRRLAASLQKEFGPILTSQETLPTLGLCLRMRFPRLRMHEIRGTLSFRFNDRK